MKRIQIFQLREVSSGKVLNHDLEIHFVELLKVPKTTKEERDSLKDEVSLINGTKREAKLEDKMEIEKYF